MEMDLDLSIIGKLLLAAVLGGIIGLEREFHHKPAGLRTNMFICVGSALYTILSHEFARRFGGDHARVAAQLIPGIGFIGAGAIIRERGGVTGLTTAATIFVVASVGMAVGASMYMTSVFASLLILTSLSFLGWAEERLSLKKHLMTFRVTTSNLEEVMSQTNQALAQMNVPMQHFQVYRVGPDFVMEFDADVSHNQQQQLAQKMSALGARCAVVPLEFQKE